MPQPLPPHAAAGVAHRGRRRGGAPCRACSRGRSTGARRSGRPAGTSQRPGPGPGTWLRGQGVDRVAGPAGPAEAAALALAEAAILDPPAVAAAAGIAAAVAQPLPQWLNRPWPHLPPSSPLPPWPQPPLPPWPSRPWPPHGRSPCPAEPAEPAGLGEEVVEQAVLGVVAPGDRRGEVGLAGGQVAGQDLPGDRVVEPVGRGRPAGRHRGEQGDREHHPSPMTEAHRHSLVVGRWNPSWSVGYRASGGEGPRRPARDARHHRQPGPRRAVAGSLPSRRGSNRLMAQATAI